MEKKTILQISGYAKSQFPQLKVIAEIEQVFKGALEFIADYPEYLRKKWKKENEGFVNPRFERRITEINIEAEAFGPPVVGLIGVNQFGESVLIIIGMKQVVARFHGEKAAKDIPYSNFLVEIKSMFTAMAEDSVFEEIEG